MGVYNVFRHVDYKNAQLYSIIYEVFPLTLCADTGKSHRETQEIKIYLTYNY